MVGIEEFLIEREKEHALRRLKPKDYTQEGKIYLDGRVYYDFSSNDYLGLAGHPRVKAEAKKIIEQLGSSASASRLLSGDFKFYHLLEERVAQLVGKEKALIFNSGYQANLGLISALCRRGDVIFLDRLSHASIIDGVLLSGAKFFRFRHNDLSHLEFLLRKERRKFKNALIVSESNFSMDGDQPDLNGLVQLKEKFNCWLMLDEAHSFGIFGENGAGMAEEEGLSSRVEIIMATFGKALGSFGAFVAGSSKLIEFLVNASRSFIYSTALPPAVVASNLIALSLLEEEPWRRKILLENSSFFREELRKKGLEVRGSTQIVPLVLGEIEKAIQLSQYLFEKGYWVFPIRYPTVPEKEARLRFSLSYHHSRNLLESLIAEISSFFDGS